MSHTIFNVVGVAYFLPFVYNDWFLKFNFCSGVAFIDFVDNFEKIGDHLTNIAEGIVKGLRWKEKIRRG